MRIVLLGPPGAGKGTQAAQVARRFRCANIATGDIFRANVAEGSELGQAAQEYMDRGDLVPDEVVIAMVMERLAERDCQAGFVLDGFPRTVNQAEALDRRLVEMGSPLQAVLCVQADENELLRRLAGRAASTSVERVCPTSRPARRMRSISSGDLRMITPAAGPPPGRRGSAWSRPRSARWRRC